MRAALTLGLSIILARTAYSVCLHEPKTIQEEYQSSESVIIGEVVSKENISDSEGFWSHQQYELSVHNDVKGKCPSRIIIRDENDSGRFPMEKGKQYLLFIENIKSIDIDPCGHSGALSEKSEVLEEVERLVEPNLQDGTVPTGPAP